MDLRRLGLLPLRSGVNLMAGGMLRMTGIPVTYVEPVVKAPSKKDATRTVTDEDVSKAIAAARAKKAKASKGK